MTGGDGGVRASAVLDPESNDKAGLPTRKDESGLIGLGGGNESSLGELTTTGFTSSKSVSWICTIRRSFSLGGILKVGLRPSYWNERSLFRIRSVGRDSFERRDPLRPR